VSRTDNPRDGSRGRLALIIVALVLVYGALGGRLVQLGLRPAVADGGPHGSPQDEVNAARPDIVDRNGEVLATDLATASLYAEPKNIVDIDEAVEKLAGALPDLNRDELRKDLSSGKGFIWLKRELSAKKRGEIHDLGVPGIGFLTETKRFYPGGASVGHVVGHVDLDNQGTAGLEKAIDEEGLDVLQSIGLAKKGASLAPVKLAMDLRVQHAVRDELARAMERYRSIAAIGIVLNARTFEVVAMSSLPDYDPNEPKQALEQPRMNRAMAGVYEMGSVFKVFTIASALDAGTVTLGSMVDARGGLSIGRFTIKDFHGKHRVLSVAEVFKYSSNVGTGRIALKMGAETQKSYLKAMGFFDRLTSELPEAAKPMVPGRWPNITAATVAFGHGIAVTPMHTAAAGAAVVNGGTYAPVTFYPRSEAETMQIGRRVISPQTSELMRQLFILNGKEGSGTRAQVPGYRVGGKTGTAEKAGKGGYSESKRFNSFLAAFPMDDPQYVVLVVLDEPQPENGKGAATAALNAAPTVANIIARTAPMLGVEPRFEGEDPVVRAIEIAYGE
jgi:cell division protein FtsI (penicillin-binding protein 3)